MSNALLARPATFYKILYLVGVCVNRIGRQGTATAEIARNVQQASIGTREVTTTIVQVNQTAETNHRESAHVLTAATDLARQTRTLGNGVDQFLSRIRGD